MGGVERGSGSMDGGTDGSTDENREISTLYRRERLPEARSEREEKIAPLSSRIPIFDLGNSPIRSLRQEPGGC